MLAQEIQTPGCFLEPVSSALLSSRGLPVKRYKVLALLSPWDPRTLPPRQPQPLSAQGSAAAGRAARAWHGHHALHSPGCSAGSGQFGIPGCRREEIAKEGDQSKHSHPMVSYSLQRAPSHSRTKGPARPGLKL